MPFVPDSRTAGYLGPRASPRQLTDDPWYDFLHGVISGVTGLAPEMVRPRWQIEPPNIPPFETDWAAFGVSNIRVDFQPAIIHHPDGYDIVQDHEVQTIVCTFYGPNAERHASFVRMGMFVHQNRAALRAQGVGLVEVSDPVINAELFKNRWLQRVDTNLILRREVRYHYNVCNLVRAQGPITAVDFGGNIHHREFDTDNLPHPEEY